MPYGARLHLAFAATALLTLLIGGVHLRRNVNGYDVKPAKCENFSKPMRLPL